MIAWLQRNPLLLLLAVLAVALAAILAFEAGFSGPSAPRAGARKPVAAEAQLLPPLATAAPEQAYPETTARPLFVPTRRPAPEVVATAAPASTLQRGQFVLQGVIVAGDQRVAMLREKASGRVHRVEAGRELNGIQVLQIEPEVVTLAQGDEREVLPLTVQKPGAAGPGQTAAAPAAAAVAQGPFAPQSGAFPGARPGVPGGPAPGQPQPNAQAAAAAPGSPGAPPAAGSNPLASPTPNVHTFPMSAEELLARRRARRAQQSQ